MGVDDDEPIASVTYDQWQDRGGMRLPMLRKLVLTLAEREELICLTQQVASEKIDDSQFQIPPQPSP